ncbi:MAG: PKD domain-containing protein [Planctomycetes bacterium]|nr:PKD domain-containing protein [Planctomycetota bacterium]
MKKLFHSHIMLVLMFAFAGMLLTQNVCADEEVISVGDMWRYFKGKHEPPTQWNSIAFNDNTWARGPTGIGYSTDIQYGTKVADMKDNYWSVFARKTFTVVDPNDISALILGIRYDDGFIAYINSTEIARSINMIDPVNYNTKAAFSHDEEAAEEFFTLTVTPGLFQSGDNVVAIEFHNNNLGSSDAGIIPRLIIIDNMLPEASVQAIYPSTGVVPLTVDFDASDSQDNDGNIVEYSWNFGDGTLDERSSNPLNRHTYNMSGVYECVLEVTDNKEGKDTTSVVVVVGPSRTFYVDGFMRGSFNGSGDAVGIYNPDKREAGSGFETAYNTFMEASLEAIAGDTIVIRAGIYRETLRPVHSGNSAAPITYTNYEDEVVIIRDTLGISNLTADEVALDQPGRQYGIYIYGISHIVIKGLQVTNVIGWCRVVQSDHIILQHNKFSAALGHGTTGSIKFYHSDYNKIINNVIHDGQDNLLLIHSDKNLVEGNSFMKGRHTLWSIRGGNFNIIRDNYFHNELQKIGEVYDVEAAKHAPIKYDAAHYNIIEKNIFAKTASSGNHSSFAGIQYAGQHGIIRQNIFYETIGPAFNFTLYSSEAMYNYENRLYNNVFYKSDFAGISISGSQSYTFHGNIMKNNIFLQSNFVANDKRSIWYTGELAGKPVQLMTGRLDGFVFENNNLFNQHAGELYLITYGTRVSSSNPLQHEVSWWEDNYPAIFKNNLEEDPLFVDAGNHDYHLTKESPMIDAGDFLTVITSPGGGGSQITVADSRYFYDGFGIVGEQGDLIKFESGQTARILDIDYGSDSNTIILDRHVSWSNGEKVSLYYEGGAPDIGAYESIPPDVNNLPPVLHVIGDKTVDGNVILTFEINAADPNGDPITYSARNLPNGAVFSGRTFSWKPNIGQIGNYRVRFIASDGNSQVSQTITITVSNVNRPPILGQISGELVEEINLFSPLICLMLR